MGYKVDFKQMNHIFEQLSDEYDIYAPKRFKKQGRYSDTDIVRYDRVENIEDVVFDQKSDYPAKEVLSPILNHYSILQKMSTEKVRSMTKRF